MVEDSLRVLHLPRLHHASDGLIVIEPQTPKLKELFKPILKEELSKGSSFSSVLKQIENLKRGCVVFWKGHVGIMVDKFSCIHANAFHMQTKVERLSTIVNRMSKDFDIINEENQLDLTDSILSLERVLLFVSYF